MKPVFCICGKLCTSKPGLTLHQRMCEKALEALKKSESTTMPSGILEPEIQYDADIQVFLDKVKDISIDAHLAISVGNKSAGKRARTALIELRNSIIPLRKKILDRMHGE
jgi:hypothetical protein